LFIGAGLIEAEPVAGEFLTAPGALPWTAESTAVSLPLALPACAACCSLSPVCMVSPPPVWSLLLLLLLLLLFLLLLLLLLLLLSLFLYRYRRYQCQSLSFSNECHALPLHGLSRAGRRSL
jgi:hypothetical protein